MHILPNILIVWLMGGYHVLFREPPCKSLRCKTKVLKRLQGGQKKKVVLEGFLMVITIIARPSEGF